MLESALMQLHLQHLDSQEFSYFVMLCNNQSITAGRTAMHDVLSLSHIVTAKMVH